MTQTNRPAFPAGTFSPDPRPNAVPLMLAAQFSLELKLLLRNGEQLLLTMFIPITLLVGLTLLPMGSFGHNRAATFVPVIMALAVISTAFTGQAIAVAFDRRYGALKRLGATPLPVGGSSPASRWQWLPWCSCRPSSWAPSALRSAGGRR